VWGSKGAEGPVGQTVSQRVKGGRGGSNAEPRRGMGKGTARVVGMVRGGCVSQSWGVKWLRGHVPPTGATNNDGRGSLLAAAALLLELRGARRLLQLDGLAGGGLGLAPGAGDHRRARAAVDGLEDLSDEPLESLVDVGGVEGGGLEEQEPLLLRELVGRLLLHRPLALEIALVADEHDDGARGDVGDELVQPVGDVVKGLLVRDVIDEHRALRAVVDGAGDGAEALLPRRIPDLHLHVPVLDLQPLRHKLNADGGGGLHVELVAGVPRHEV